ncbi:hypothetical protein UlMin_035658 [Ulmus minor]
MSVIWVLGFLFFALVGHRVEASQCSSPHEQGIFQFRQEEQPYRTGFHFQTSENWMNDPNGPMYYKGVYHLFYQYNPYSAEFGNITWGHSISYNLIDWFHLDIALHPNEHYDINGCWSGSITFLPGQKPAILYTGIDTENRQVQNLAIPKNLSDPFLREWVKSPHNPIMVPPNGIEPDDFRDPTTAWQGPDGLWRVIIGSQIDGHGMAILYTSKDLVNWTKAETPLHSSSETSMWECPDFFPVSSNSTDGVDNFDQGEFNKYVLKTSLFFSKHDYYILGKYTTKTDTFLVENSDFTESVSDLRLDYGKFYASKTFYDSAKKRRVVWAWVNESDSISDDIMKGWAGLQSFPRSVFLSKSGRQLVQWPIKEIEELRTGEVDLQRKGLEGGSVFEISGITASQADVEVSFDVSNLEEAELMDPSWVDPQLLCSEKDATIRGKIGPFGLLVLASEDLTEQTAVFFRIFRNRSTDKYVVLMCSDQSRSSMREGLDKTTYGAFVDIDPRHEKITLRSLIDHSIVESFGGEGRTCITARVYPGQAIYKEAHLYAFNNGSVSVEIQKLNAWSMNTAQIVPMKETRRSPTVTQNKCSHDFEYSNKTTWE